MNAEQITNSLPPELMSWLENTFSNFSAIAVVVFLVFALWGAFQGFRRSIFRQVIHVAVTLVIAIIAFHCTSFVCDNILASFNEMSMQEFIKLCADEGVILPEETQSVLLSFDMTTIGYAIAIIINTVVAPLIFAILFAIIGVVGKVVTSVLCFFVPKGQSLTYKLIGIVGGIVEGAIIACVVLLPLVGWVNIAGSAVDVVRENAVEDDPTATEIVEFYDEFVEPLENHAIFQMVGGLGGNNMLKDLATVEINGEERDLREQLTVALKLGYDVSKLSGADFLNLTPENKDTILAIIEDCDESLIISKLSCGVVNGMASAIEDGAILIQIDEPYYSILMEAVSILGSEKTNETTLGENLTTFANIYFLLSDEGVLAVFEKTEDGAATNEDALTEALTKKDDEGNTVLNKVIDELNKNENTKDLIPLVAKLAVSVIVPEGAEDAYENVKEGFGELVQIDTNRPEEEVKTDVANTLEGIVEDFGLSVGGEDGIITNEQLDEIAGIVTKELKDGNIDIPVGEDGKVSDADLINLLLQYGALFGQTGESEGQGE